MTIVCTNHGLGQFPADQWLSDFKELVAPTPEPARLFEESDPSLKLPNDTLQQEFEALLYLQRLRDEDPARVKEILEDAQLDWRVEHRLLAAAGLMPGGTLPLAVKRAIRAVQAAVEPTLFRVKATYARARPYMCCTELRPLIEPGASFDPAHGAFPSGHATTAYLYALLLGRRPDANQAVLMKLAKRIAENREVGGFHYPSDSAGGLELARVVDAHIFDPQNPYAASPVLASVKAAFGIP